ncbi:MAG: HAD family hydrolase [Thermodesulfobacteriota bacterium]
MSNIRVVLLDLGNVLVEFSHLPIGEGLSRYAKAPGFGDPQEVIRYLFKEKPSAEDPFDEGRLSPLEFFQLISMHMGLEMSFEEFVEIWNSIFRERRGARKLIEFLKGKVGLHLLSNTNLLHFQHCLEQFPWLKEMDSWFLSYELGRKKPHPELYGVVVKSLGCRPQEILYLDDIEENLEPARDMGFQTSLVLPNSCLEDLIRPWFPDLPRGKG